MKDSKKRIMIIGSTSGIGKALAELCLEQGFIVGGVGRNEARLKEMAKAHDRQFFAQVADIRHRTGLNERLDALAERMGGVDIVVVSSSISRKNPDLLFEIENDVLQTNIVGYTAALIWAVRFFLKQGHGHLVGITSLAKFLGGKNPAYTASKAFESRYLEGLRLRLAKTGITVSEIMPGFVRTPMTEDQERMFWAISPERAAECILKAIRKKKQKTVISRRWKPFYWILPHLPFRLLKYFLV